MMGPNCSHIYNLIQMSRLRLKKKNKESGWMLGVLDLKIVNCISSEDSVNYFNKARSLLGVRKSKALRIRMIEAIENIGAWAG